MNLFELTDEQLEEVVGGNSTNFSNQVNEAFAPNGQYCSIWQECQSNG